MAGEAPTVNHRVDASGIFVLFLTGQAIVIFIQYTKGLQQLEVQLQNAIPGELL